QRHARSSRAGHLGERAGCQQISEENRSARGLSGIQGNGAAAQQPSLLVSGPERIGRWGPRIFGSLRAEDARPSSDPIRKTEIGVASTRNPDGFPCQWPLNSPATVFISVRQLRTEASSPRSAISIISLVR